MVAPKLASPVWRIASATGEEPADVEAALATLRAEGFDHDDLWALIADALEHRETIVAMTERVVALAHANG